MNRKVIYPGTFDPLTFGHLDIIKRASKIFDEVIVGVAKGLEKEPMFTLDERLSMLKQAVKDIKNVTVEKFDGLAVDFAKRKGVRIIIRGLRMISDFEYEFQMALTNRKLDDEIETIFMMPSEDYSYLSSKLIKEAAFLGGSVKNFVPDFVETALKKKLKRS